MSSDLHKFFLLIVVVSAVFCLIKYTLANNECQQSCWRMNLVCQRKCASNNSFTKCKEGCDKECIPKDVCFNNKTQCYNSCWGTNIECLRKCASDNSFTKCKEGCDKVNEKCENTCRDGFQQCVFDSENCLSSRSQ
uniref:Hypotheticial protein n=1 Tax=Schistosoma japonicum TaxID=6182 RepID=C7TY57_SCHJA|nr:hypotheticial protein [Schistosoma japonicum]CAX82604.1 hypotheticial protein [Schistosoma japonicum]CAX82815.1 hypotheticial protein [Schistosoma japonicum]CAX82949.1 hypotheticial protein [Schistosoma japonicum]